jgi:hypothetical protein
MVSEGRGVYHSHGTGESTMDIIDICIYVILPFAVGFVVTVLLFRGPDERR